jgi:CheY-like chemotaxis protein
MPGMTGLELLGQIKKVYNLPPPFVMMITAYNDEKTYNEAIRLGADDFLTKPIDFVLLKEKLNLITK